MIKAVIFSMVGAVLAVLVLWLSTYTVTGQVPSVQESKHFEASAQWQGSRFGNSLVQQPVDLLKAGPRFLFGGNTHSEPKPDLVFEPTNDKVFDNLPNSGLRVTWLGHSTFLLELDGLRILVDPVWGERASPFTSMGAKRFYPVPLALEDLPKIDAILISHDHYDHLDVSTVDYFKQHNVPWYVPLGVGSHLRFWGVEPDKVNELDWWQVAQLGELELVAIPSRHSSGRSVFLNDTKQTLWSGWVVKGPKHRVVYSGDTAMHPAFAEIGEKLGPFDLSIIEIGAYNALWRDNHLGPEQALRAHQLLQARAMLPVHWAGYDLAVHNWTAPIERLKAAIAQQQLQLRLYTPKPGQPFELGEEAASKTWWPTVPWQTAEQDPIRSSQVDELFTP